MATARNHLNRILVGAIVATSLAGCSQACTSVAVVGRYTMRSGTDVYELNLAKDGVGSLSRNGVVEAFNWEWWSDSEQPFLHVSRGLLDDLMGRSGHPTPRDSANFRSGYLGLVPKCRAGSAAELDIGVDGELRFVRID